MADKKSSLVQIHQAVLDETFQALKVINADPSSGGATEVTAQEILTAVESIDAKIPAAPATAGNQASTNTKLDTLIAQTDGVEGSLASIDTKTPALIAGRQPVDGSGVTQPISAATLPLPSGAATSAQQTTAQATLADISANAATTATSVITLVNQTDALENSINSIDAKIPPLGQQLAADSTPVVLTAAQITTLTPQTNALTDTQLRATAVPVSGTVAVTGVATETTLSAINTKLGSQTDVNLGTPSANTQRVAAMIGVGSTAVSATNPVPVSNIGGTSIQLVSTTVHPYYQDFSTSSLTTAYTQVVASVGTAVQAFSAINNSATPIYISTGAAASEVVRYIVMPGETTGRQLLTIASGTRIAISTQSGTESSGKFALNVFSN